MKEPFSDFVHLLVSSREILDPEPFDRVWTALRAVLRRELRRRDLWSLPPSYLGVSGRTSWSGATGTAGRGPGRHDDALEELAADCYTYVFLTRLDSLQAQLKLKPNIEGLVLLSVRSFLLERQRRFDPIGSRVYEVLRSAVRRGVAEEVCFVQSGDRRIRSATVIAFEPGTADGEPAADALLADTARELADALLPDLVTAVGRAQATIERRILDHLRRLPQRGVDRLRFGALLNPLKTETRTRWGAVFHRSLGEVVVDDVDDGFVHLVRSIRPDTSFEDRQSFDDLDTRIARELERRDADEGTVRYLSRLWRFLRAYALADEPQTRPPSHRKIAAELRIPRDRLPRLCATLGELIREQRADDSSRPVIAGRAGGA